MTKISYRFSNGQKVEVEVDTTIEAAEVLVTLERQDASSRRKARRHNEASVEEMHEQTGWEAIDESQNIEAEFEEREEKETLLQAVAQLSKKQQRLVQLYYYEEKSFTEIATILGIDRRNVSRQLETIHKQLKNFFK